MEGASIFGKAEKTSKTETRSPKSMSSESDEDWIEDPHALTSPSDADNNANGTRPESCAATTTTRSKSTALTRSKSVAATRLTATARPTSTVITRSGSAATPQSSSSARRDTDAAQSPPTVAADAVADSRTMIDEMQDVASMVSKMEAVVCCNKNCFIGKRDASMNFFLSLSRMSKSERQVSLLTALGTAAVVADKQTGDRERFQYYIPFVGAVCKYAFESAYEISHRTLHLYRKRLRDGWISAKEHGNTENKNAAAINEDTLVEWFTAIAELVGEVVPVRVQRKPQGASKQRRYFSYADHTLLPPALTWELLSGEYKKYLDDHYVDTPRPSHAAFVRILHKRCPTIRIRSGRSQVCDVCSIYRARMTADADAIETETFGEHLAAAKAMRVEYQLDVGKSNKDNIVLIMDYAQNLTLPHVPDVPSSWYFLSLVAVSMFGVYCANDATYNHFMYSETKGGKGANEVTSMLHHALDLYGVFEEANKERVCTDATDVRVTVWADNCGGQNKNSQGHTKNACDRGFGIIKRFMRRESCWTMAALVDAVDRATENVNVVNLDLEEAPFWSSKKFFEVRYKKLAGIQKYHIFHFTRKKPGFVECKHTPASEGTWIQLDKAKRPVAYALAEFMKVWRSVPSAKNKPRNPEKAADIHKKILPFVPSEFADDPMYEKPSDAVADVAREIKRARRKKADEKRKHHEEEEDEGKEAVV